MLLSAAFRLTHARDSMLHVSGFRSFRLPAGSPTAPRSARTQTVRCVFYAWMEARAPRIQMARIELKVRGSCLLPVLLFVEAHAPRRCKWAGG